MTEKTNENILYALSVLGDVLESRDFSIRVKDSTITEKEAKIKELEAKIANEFGSEVEYMSTIGEQAKYIANLEAKVAELEERIAIMTETEPPADSTNEVVETVNITKVLEGEKK